MGGIVRMHDPTEREHDRVRRRLMNLSFLLLLLLLLLDGVLYGLTARKFLWMLAWAIASVPLALGVRVFELRFKMAAQEWTRVLRELLRHATVSLSICVLLGFGVVAVVPTLATMSGGVAPIHALDGVWVLFGVWLSDFLTYYRHRPERMRHLYMVTATLDDLRGFRRGMLWPLSALALEAILLVW
jgi:hypothetical protein